MVNLLSKIPSQGIQSITQAQDIVDEWIPTLNSEMYEACEAGQLDEAKEAVSWGAGVNFVTSVGVTPFMVALRGGHQPLIEWILEFEELDVNIGMTEDKLTTLDYALEYDNIAVVKEVCLRTRVDRVTNVDSLIDAARYEATRCYGEDVGSELCLFFVVGLMWPVERTSPKFLFLSNLKTMKT